MCWECRILGPLVHVRASDDGADPSSSLVRAVRGRDFVLADGDAAHADLIDRRAAAYLSETLALYYAETGVKLVPIRVHTDGSCLPHAVSRALVGKEVLFDAVRAALVDELETHAQWYAERFRHGMDDETWKAHWADLVDEARPTRGAPTGRWLGPGEHLAALANALARPVALLDELATLQKDDHRSGLVLPARLSREDVLKAHGNLVPGPVVLGWAGPKKTHFVSLIRVDVDDAVGAVEDDGEAARAALKTIVYGREDDETFEMTLPSDRAPGDVVRLTDPETQKPFDVRVPADAVPGEAFTAVRERSGNPFETALLSFQRRNPPSVVAATAKTLDKICANVFDATISNDVAHMEKTRVLKRLNKAVARSVYNVPFAVELLRRCGFEETADGLRYVDGTTDRDVDVVQARDAFRYTAATARALATSTRAVREPDVLERLFGPVPLAFDDGTWTWERALAEYGYACSKKAAPDETTFLIGSGPPATRAEERYVDEVVAGLKRDFRALARNTEFDVSEEDWDDLFLYNRKITRVACPACGEEQDWTGDVDGVAAHLHVQRCSACAADLDATMTGAARTAAYFHQLLTSDALGSVKACANCRSPNLASAADCATCRAALG